MQLLIIFGFVLSVTWAAPQNYIPPETVRAQQQQQQFVQHTSVSSGGEKYLPPATTTAAPLVHKQFYLISAPEDTENIGKTKHLVLGRPQQNYRVVFIKAPSSENANLRLSAEFAPQEEKTVIYVLSKKDSGINANDIVTPAPTNPSKPEIYFIKYKTDEEAQAAQKEIQEQYDQLGGTNEFADETVVPITSIVGSLDGLTPDGAYNYRKIQSDTTSATNLPQYLPPNHKN